MLTEIAQPSTKVNVTGVRAAPTQLSRQMVLIA